MKHLFGSALLVLLLITAGCSTTPSDTTPTTSGPTSAIGATTAPDGVTTSPATGTDLTALPGDSTTATSVASDTTATSAAGGITNPSISDIAAILADDTRFSTLAAAITTAGLADTLAQAGPYTLFAPTNEAFAALPADQLQTLLADPNALAELLQYHVASGSIRSSDLGALNTIPTLSGKSISLSQSGTSVMLDGRAQVTTADIETANGVIHQIDTVLTHPRS